MYAYKTGVYFRLSTDQISDNIGAVSDVCSPEIGGTFKCAMEYVRWKGVMTQVDYEKNGYNVKRIIPIQVLNIQHEHRPIIYEDFLDRLNRGPVVTYLSSTPNYFEDTINETDSANHAVVALNVCVYEDNGYIEYLNSFGDKWGSCNGMGYLLITENNSIVINNRGVFTWQMSADVSKIYLMYTFDDNLWISIGLQCGQLLLVLVTTISVIVFWCKHKK
jgi:hypothetical protein